ARDDRPRAPVRAAQVRIPGLDGAARRTPDPTGWDVRSTTGRTSGGTVRRSWTGSLGFVMRLLGGLGLLAPISLLVVWIAVPDAIDSWTDDGSRSVVAAIVAG